MRPAENSPRDYRAALDRLRAREPHESGGLADGLGDDDPMIIASFQNPYVCRRFRRELSAVGVPSTKVQQRGKTAVEVKFQHRQTAWEVLARQRVEYPDQPGKRTRRAFDFTLLMGLLASFVGLAGISLSPNVSARVAIWFACVASGLVLGYLVDRFQRSSRYQGRFQVGIRDFLLLTIAVAGLLCLWNLVVQFLL